MSDSECQNAPDDDAYVLEQAKAGNLYAQQRLASDFMETEPKQAFYWFNKAGKQGDTGAQYLVARAYAPNMIIKWAWHDEKIQK